MYWYIVHVKSINADKLVRKLNSKPNIEAFIPKKEKWFHVKSVNNYVIEELHLDYVFIKTTIEKKNLIMYLIIFLKF